MYCHFVMALLMVGTVAVPARSLDVILINDVPDGHPRPKYALQIEAIASWHTICYKPSVFQPSKMFGFDFETCLMDV